MNLDEYVKTVGDYADQLATAADAADRDSLSAAIAMGEMFEDKNAWVELGKELVPIPKNPKSNRSWQPDTIERFHKVTNALLEQSGRASTIRSRATTENAIKCHRLVGCIPKSEQLRFRGQRQVLPLYPLWSAGLKGRIPEAVALAVEESEGKPLSGSVVGRAARLVKHNAEQGRAGLGQHKLDRLRAKRVKAEIAVLDFLDLAAKVKATDKDRAVEQLRDFSDFLNNEMKARRK